MSNARRKFNRPTFTWIRRLWCRIRGGGPCDLRFTLQGRYATVVDLSAYRIENSALTIHGFALQAGAGINEDQFINTPEDEITASLNTYLDRRGLKPGRNDLLVLDMEPRYPDPTNPGKQISFSPGNLGRYNPERQAELVEGYVRRIIAARDVLVGGQSSAKLGLYGVIVPDGKGEVDARFRQRMEGYGRAGTLGLYDFVDFLVPVLYHRFGPNDVPANGGFDMEKLHRWIGQSTRQAIVSTQRLRRRNGQTIPVAPILTFWVANGNSAHHHKVISPRTMSFQLQLLQAHCAVERILLWSGTETREEMDDAGYESFDFDDFLGRVAELPLPRCR